MNGSLLPLLLVGIAALVAIAFVVLGFGGSSKTAAPPYRRVGSLLTPAELAFYGVLRQSLPEGQTLLAKVRVADLLEVDAQGDVRQGWLNKVVGRHVDFVVCNAESMAPLAAIELDDASHNQPDRQQRDSELDAAFAAAGLALVRYPVTRVYDAQLVRERLKQAMGERGDRKTSTARKTSPKRT